jgi:hypothetical protein
MGVAAMQLTSNVVSSCIRAACSATAPLLVLGACGGRVDAPGDTSGDSGAAFPASSPDNPQVVDLGGPRILHPKLVVYFDPTDADAASMTSYLSDLAASDFWQQTTGEYGIGAIASVTSMPLSAPVSTDLSDTSVAELLAPLATSYLAENPDAGGATSVVNGVSLRYDTLFVLVTPSSVACSTESANHGSMTAGSVTVPYAFSQRCPDTIGALTPAQHEVALLTHEVVDAATCPFPNTAPAYAHVDDDHLAWSTTDGAPFSTELNHMCESNRTPVTIGAQTVTLERVWSNAAAAAGHDRCVPVPAGSGPEVLAVPVLTDHVPFATGQTTLGVTLAQGASTTIAVNLVSDAPTSAAWYVEAVDVAAENGRPAELALTLDESRGENGDVVHLTITRLQPPDPSSPVSGVVFELVASEAPDFSSPHVSFGFVSNG